MFRIEYSVVQQGQLNYDGHRIGHQVIPLSPCSPMPLPISQLQQDSTTRMPGIVVSIPALCINIDVLLL